VIAEFDNGRLEKVVNISRVSSNQTRTLLLVGAGPFGFCTNFVSALLGRLAVKLDDERDEQRTQDTQEDLTTSRTTSRHCLILSFVN